MLRIKAEGKIVYYKPNDGLYFYDVTNEEKHIIPNTIDIFTPLIASSPDHKRIAFFDFDNGAGWVISANGNRTEVYIKEKINGIFYGWLDNKRVIFVDRSHSDGSIVTLDIDTGIVNKTATGLHDLFSLGPNRWYAGGDQPTAIFDSTLSRLIYLSGELPNEAVGKWGFIMRDMETQKVLWSSKSNDLGVQPKWSPDNSHAAILITSENESNDQIYIVNREGQDIQTIDTNIIGVDLIEWSPDGTEISYAGKDVLEVYDFASKELQEYQLDEQAAVIVWSPTGKQIATKGFLIDRPNGCVFKLEPDNQFEPLAWLADTP